MSTGDRNLDALTRQGVNAQCDAWDAALDSVEQCFAAYREMIAGFRASGTLVPTEAVKAKIRSLLPDAQTDAALLALDTLAGVGPEPKVTP